MKMHQLRLSSITLSLFLGLSAITTQAQQVISLDQAIALAHQNDPWLQGNELQQQAIEYRSIASNTLPDPTVSLSIANLPTDAWNLEQEGMTQLKVGVAQMFPRGDSLTIKANQLKIEASKYPLLRAERKAKLTTIVSELWLEAYLAQQTVRLIEADWSLFEQMAEVAKVSYANAVGKTRQQDVIRAQLEIVQLEDRLTAQKQKLETSVARLNEWLHVVDISAIGQGNQFESQFAYFDESTQPFRVSEKLPQLALAKTNLLKNSQYSRSQLAQELMDHPALAVIDIKQQVFEKNIDLAEQQYKPQWGVNASYGYRDDTPSGDSRADLFSVGVSFDLPLFTENKQDKQVAASVAEAQAIKTEKLLLTKQMISAVEKEVRQLQRLSQRQAIYQQQLLTQTEEQAEASLTAYTNDDGDFAEVVRSRIAQLNARISALQIDVEALKAVARVNYFFSQASNQNTYQNPYQNKGLQDTPRLNVKSVGE
ncbi:TolC family protein [Thalassotalea sp. LPB0316]|uniref:TolC family protein n=1 Tax=Thalassotalea sp. LPB0316 TaxID=2769490 RepID=UPI001868AF01|nr:TolC family protein [Thalassotalea sp. LPB0316]QOL25650.1 TolC family protein [Thalassotalea sp. LPB0316]